MLLKEHGSHAITDARPLKPSEGKDCAVNCDYDVDRKRVRQNHVSGSRDLRALVLHLVRRVLFEAGLTAVIVETRCTQVNSNN